MSEENQINWRIQLESQYAVICKFCSRKVMDPDKNNGNQIFTKSKCPHCFTSKDTYKQKQPKNKFRIAC